ncbi:hypothetical protein A1Q2_03425 [Trichosporon asahii var. asahii CBS 8904]|uniref:Mitochondrial escape protein 2 n=1 Tax=Trichosporon asahii var. asahii (strain CBS 8904) TaxID=1220162 RepID=K1VZP7_TRIAC|nr:hypothetical protein A1Q2_03425 [Trichosporon asahii var. asahii CBS 8904]
MLATIRADPTPKAPRGVSLARSRHPRAYQLAQRYDVGPETLEIGTASGVIQVAPVDFSFFFLYITTSSLRQNVSAMIPRGRGSLSLMRRQPLMGSASFLLRPQFPAASLVRPTVATGSPLRLVAPSIRFYADDAQPPPKDEDAAKKEDSEAAKQEKPEEKKVEEEELDASDPEAVEAARQHASFYISNVLPIKLSGFDIRPKLAEIREQTIMEQLNQIVGGLKGRHAFRLESYEIARKDGGVFFHFTYLKPKLTQLPRKHQGWTHEHAPEDEAPEPTSPAALFLPPLLESAQKHGGWPSWLGKWWSNFTDRHNTPKTESGHEYYRGGAVPVREPELRGWQRDAGAGRAWVVKGRQWTEDLSRYPSSQLKVEFAGPDVGQEVLYSLFRPYGRIIEIVPPSPVPAGALRYSILKFSRISTAVAASNCLHSYSTPTSQIDYDLVKKQPDQDVTRSTLKICYEQPLKGHYFRDWVRDHPKIAIPILAFLLGGLSYSFFDPIRSFFVRNDIEGTWDLEKYQTVKFVRDNIWLPVYNTLTGQRNRPQRKRNVDDLGRASWQDRMEAEANIEKWIREFPSTFIVVTGPPGSGKHELVHRMIEGSHRPSLEIDCAEVAKAKTDGDLVKNLAAQTSYWPVFSFLQSMNGLIDLAAQGLIGQKAGFSTPIDEQLRNMLDVVTTALKGVTQDEQEDRLEAARHAEREKKTHFMHEAARESINNGTYHDGRLDCIAGNGVMSELGFGQEPMTSKDARAPKPKEESTEHLVARAQAALADKPPPAEQSEDTADEAPVLDTNAETISTLPIVVLRNFSAKPARGDLWKVLAEWGAGLLDNKIAHVIVVGEGSLTTKTLTHALPSKPLNHVTLSDADTYNSLEFVREKLSSSEKDKDGNPKQYVLSEKEKDAIAKLGGRMVDLELLVYKVRGGQSITQAVADIVLRNEVELRKQAFGDDSEDAASLPWSRAQAWKLVTELARAPELSYEKLLQYYPFKGGDMALKAMEERDIVTIVYRDGRAYAVRPGKPVFREAFRQLEADSTFAAASQIAYNNSVISAAEAAIKGYEEELNKLKALIGEGDGLKLSDKSRGWLTSWWGESSPINQRAKYLLEQMDASMKKIAAANADNACQLEKFNPPTEGQGKCRTRLAS